MEIDSYFLYHVMLVCFGVAIFFIGLIIGGTKVANDEPLVICSKWNATQEIEMDKVTVWYRKLYQEAKMFSYTHPLDACRDMYVGLQFDKDGKPLYMDATKTTYMPWIVRAGETKVIGTGISIELPKGFCGIVKGRSGLTSKGILVQLGTIETDYRGEVGITVYNASCTDWACNPFDRIAQFCVEPVYLMDCFETDEPIEKWTNTIRGTKGYGSSGL